MDKERIGVMEKIKKLVNRDGDYIAVRMGDKINELIEVVQLMAEVMDENMKGFERHLERHNMDMPKKD